MSDAPRIGRLDTVVARERPDLVGPTVTAALGAAPALAAYVAEIVPALADTAAFCEAYEVPPELSANCVVVAGRRGGDERVAACLVLATTRADVNGVVRRRLDVRKASFLAMDRAVELTGMEYGGITPLGLPGDWPVFVDAAVAALPFVVVGSGVRRSKLLVSGDGLAALPRAEVVPGLGVPAS
ncbi:MAG TPA: YbaK/EbsC family protein [Jiangellales bacterium]|nr:YbaK/EbsC family protein [Jiangellales bacterium]